MRVWVQDRAWHLPARKHRCSFPLCSETAVAVLRRRRRIASSRFGRADYHYCGDHLYGRRIANGRVEVRVHPDSRAAGRGYTNEIGYL